jgi:hypothetical protein
MQRISGLTDRDLAAVLKRGFSEDHADLFARNGWIRSATAEEIQRDWIRRFPKMKGNPEGALLLQFNPGSPSLRPYQPPIEVLSINGKLIQRPCKYLYSVLLPGDPIGSNVQPWIPPAELGRPVCGTEGLFDALVATYLIGVPTIGFTAPSHVRGSKIPPTVKVYFSDSDVPYHHHPGLMPVVIGQCAERGLKLAHLPRFPGAQYAYTDGVIPEDCKSGAEEWYREWRRQGLDPRDELLAILKGAQPAAAYFRSIVADYQAAGLRWPLHQPQIINAARATYDATDSQAGRDALLRELSHNTGIPLATAKHQMLRRKAAAEVAAKKRSGDADQSFAAECAAGTQSVIVPTINAETYPNTHEAREHKIISVLNRLESSRTKHQKTNVLVVADAPGSGKTHTLSNAWESILSSIGDWHFFYASPDYRNVDEESFPGLAELEMPPVRHGGIVVFQSAGRVRYRRYQPPSLEEQAAGASTSPELAEDASCERIAEIEDLLRKGAGPQLISDYCKGCPVRGEDKANPSCSFVREARDWAKRLDPSTKCTQIDEPDVGLQAHEVKGSLIKENGIHWLLLPNGAMEPIPSPPDIRAGLGYIGALPRTYRENALLYVDEAPQLFKALLDQFTIRRDEITHWISSIARWYRAFQGLSDETPDPSEQQLLIDGLQLLHSLMDGFDPDLSPHGRDCPSIRQAMAPWTQQVRARFTNPLTGELNLPTVWQQDQDTSLDQTGSERNDKIQNFPLRLATLIRSILGFGSPAACHMLKAKNRKGANLRLHITASNPNTLELLHSFRHILITDATVDQHLLLQALGGAEAVNMAAIRSTDAPGADVRIHQIVDLGSCGRQRRPELSSRINETIAGIKRHLGRNTNVAVLRPGSIAAADEGRWLTQDSRGGNQFQHAHALISDGLPRANVNAALSDFIALTGHQSASMGDPLFDAHQAVSIGAELIQGIHRTRITRRPGERIDIFILSNADLSDLPWPVTHELAEQYAPDTRSRSTFLMQLTHATYDLKAASGKPPSLRAVADATGIPRSTISDLAAQVSPHGSWTSFRDLATANRSWHDPDW